MIDRGGWSTPLSGRFTPGKYPVPIVQDAGRDPGPVWTGAENLAPTGIRSPDRRARSDCAIPARWTLALRTRSAVDLWSLTFAFYFILFFETLDCCFRECKSLCADGVIEKDVSALIANQAWGNFHIFPAVKPCRLVNGNRSFGWP